MKEHQDEIDKCSECSTELEALNPPVEEYIDYKLLIRIPFTNWKFMLLQDHIEYGCIPCQIENDQSKQNDIDREVFNAGAQMGYEKAMEGER